MPVVVEVTLIPLGVGSSVSKYVAKAVEHLRSKGVSYHLTPTSTVFEAPNREEALRIVDELNELVFQAGAPRVVTVIKLDERRDKPNWNMNYKLRTVEEKLS